MWQTRVDSLSTTVDMQVRSSVGHRRARTPPTNPTPPQASQLDHLLKTLSSTRSTMIPLLRAVESLRHALDEMAEAEDGVGQEEMARLLALARGAAVAARPLGASGGHGEVRFSGPSGSASPVGAPQSMLSVAEAAASAARSRSQRHAPQPGAGLSNERTPRTLAVVASEQPRLRWRDSPPPPRHTPAAAVVSRQPGSPNRTHVQHGSKRTFSASEVASFSVAMARRAGGGGRGVGQSASSGGGGDAGDAGDASEDSGSLRSSGDDVDAGPGVRDTVASWAGASPVAAGDGGGVSPLPMGPHRAPLLVAHEIGEGLGAGAPVADVAAMLVARYAAASRAPAAASPPAAAAAARTFAGAARAGSTAATARRALVAGRATAAGASAAPPAYTSSLAAGPVVAGPGAAAGPSLRGRFGGPMSFAAPSFAGTVTSLGTSLARRRSSAGSRASSAALARQRVAAQRSAAAAVAGMGGGGGGGGAVGGGGGDGAKAGLRARTPVQSPMVTHAPPRAGSASAEERERLERAELARGLRGLGDASALAPAPALAPTPNSATDGPGRNGARRGPRSVVSARSGRSATTSLTHAGSVFTDRAERGSVDAALREVFAYVCSYGQRHSKLQLLSASKWRKLLSMTGMLVRGSGRVGWWGVRVGQ